MEVSTENLFEQKNIDVPKEPSVKFGLRIILNCHAWTILTLWEVNDFCLNHDTRLRK